MPGLQVLDAGQHVQVARRVLLDHVHDVVGPQALLEPPLRHQELHDAEGETSKMSTMGRKTIKQSPAMIVINHLMNLSTQRARLECDIKIRKKHSGHYCCYGIGSSGSSAEK